MQAGKTATSPRVISSSGVCRHLTIFRLLKGCKSVLKQNDWSCSVIWKRCFVLSTHWWRWFCCCHEIIDERIGSKQSAQLANISYVADNWQARRDNVSDDNGCVIVCKRKWYWKSARRCAAKQKTKVSQLPDVSCSDPILKGHKAAREYSAASIKWY